MAPEAQELIGTARGRALADPADSDASGRLGMALHAYELREDALACYQRAAALDPGGFRWPYFLGTVQAELGRHAEAASNFELVLAIRPSLVSARIRLGESLLEAGQAAQSREAFGRAVEMAPASAASHFGLGKALEAIGDSEAAVGAYARATELEPGARSVRYALAALYRSMGRMEDSDRQLARFETGSHMEPPISDSLMAAVRQLRADKHRYLQDGLRLEAEGNLQAAVSLYEKAVGIDGGYLQARVNLIAAYGRLGRFREAETHYGATEGLASNSEELHVNWGTLEADRRNFRSAVSSYRRALEINPYSADTRVDLGIVLDEIGEADQARVAFRRALENEPRHRLANFHLARHLIAGNRVEEAIEHLLKIKEPVDDRTPTFLYGLADAYLRLGNIEQSLRYAREAAALAEEFGQTDLGQSIAEDIRSLEAIGSP